MVLNKYYCKPYSLWREMLWHEKEYTKEPLRSLEQDTMTIIHKEDIEDNQQSPGSNIRNAPKEEDAN